MCRKFANAESPRFEVTVFVCWSGRCRWALLPDHEVSLLQAIAVTPNCLSRDASEGPQKCGDRDANDQLLRYK